VTSCPLGPFPSCAAMPSSNIVLVKGSILEDVVGPQDPIGKPGGAGDGPAK